jgi:hypothetical protein
VTTILNPSLQYDDNGSTDDDDDEPILSAAVHVRIRRNLWCFFFMRQPVKQAVKIGEQLSQPKTTVAAMCCHGKQFK